MTVIYIKPRQLTWPTSCPAPESEKRSFRRGLDAGQWMGAMRVCAWQAETCSIICTTQLCNNHHDSTLSRASVIRQSAELNEAWSSPPVQGASCPVASSGQLSLWRWWVYPQRSKLDPRGICSTSPWWRMPPGKRPFRSSSRTPSTIPQGWEMPWPDPVGSDPARRWWVSNVISLFWFPLKYPPNFPLGLWPPGWKNSSHGNLQCVVSCWFDTTPAFSLNYEYFNTAYLL